MFSICLLFAQSILWQQWKCKTMPQRAIGNLSSHLQELPWGSASSTPDPITEGWSTTRSWALGHPLWWHCHLVPAMAEHCRGHRPCCISGDREKHHSWWKCPLEGNPSCVQSSGCTACTVHQLWPARCVWALEQAQTHQGDLALCCPSQLEHSS